MLKKILIVCLIFIGGCVWFSDKRIVTKPEPERMSEMQRWLANRNKWMLLASHVELYFDTTGWTTEEIAAELYLADYMLFSTPTNEISKK